MCGPYVHTKESLIMSTLTTGTYEKYGVSYKTLTLTDGKITGCTAEGAE